VRKRGKKITRLLHERTGKTVAQRTERKEGQSTQEDGEDCTEKSKKDKERTAIIDTGKI